jgi:PASTA domain
MPEILGKNIKGGYIIGGIVGIGGLAYFWYKHKETAAAAATPAASASSGVYGYGYGGYGYQNPAFNEPYIGGEYGYGGLYGYGIGAGYGVGAPTAPVQVATTNAAWAQAAENYLTTSGGYDPGTVAAALGIYITGSTLSAAQQAVVEAAIAFEGYPPQAGANGYPPAMHTSQPVGQGGGGTGTTVTVPSITGLSIDNAGVTLSSEGLKIRVISPPVRNHNYTYTILTQIPKAGAQANKNSSVNVTAKKGAKV